MLDFVPAQLRVLLIRRPRYGCRACGTIHQAPAPERPIAGGLASEALLAHVLVGKYCDHLPLYRQSQIFARQGIELDRSTLATGSVGPAGGWSRCRRAWLPTSSARTRSLPTTRLCRCSTPAAAAPRPAGCGAMRSMTGPGRVPIHPPRSTSTARTARRSARPPTSRASGHPPGRRLCGLRAADHTRQHRARLLLGALAAQVLRGPRGDRLTDRRGSAAPDRRALCDRADDPRPHGRRAPQARQQNEAADRCHAAWLQTELTRISGRGALAEAIRYALARWEGLSASSTTAASSSTPTPSSARSGRSRCVSHCAPLLQVSVNIGSVSASATRHGRPFRAIAVLTGVRRQVVGPDLIRRARHDLLGGKDAGLDEAADRVVRDAERLRGLGHGQPFAILLRRAVGVDAAHASNRATRCAVQVLPWPVGMPIRLSDAAISSSDQRPAMLRITASASSGVAQPCSPVRACGRAAPSAGRPANGSSARPRAPHRRHRR